MDEVRARERRIYFAIIVGGAGVAAVSVALAAAGFPFSIGSMVFVGAFAGSVILALLSYGARLLVKAPATIRVTRPIVFRAVSRMSCIAAQAMLLVVALVALPFGHGAARLLFRGFIVGMMIGAVWLMASDAAINFALLSKRFRASITPPE